MKKHITFTILASALIFSLTGCNSNSANNTDENPEITTSTVSETTTGALNNFPIHQALEDDKMVLITVPAGTPVYKDSFNKAVEIGMEDYPYGPSDILFYTSVTETFVLSNEDQIVLNNFGKEDFIKHTFNTIDGPVVGYITDFTFNEVK